VGKVIIPVAVILVIIILGPPAWKQGGMGGVAGLLVVVWAALMIYLVGLIVVRLKRGLGSEEGRFNMQMAQFLAQTAKEEPSAEDDQEQAADKSSAAPDTAADRQE